MKRTHLVFFMLLIIAEAGGCLQRRSSSSEMASLAFSKESDGHDVDSVFRIEGAMIVRGDCARVQHVSKSEVADTKFGAFAHRVLTKSGSFDDLCNKNRVAVPRHELLETLRSDLEQNLKSGGISKAALERASEAEENANKDFEEATKRIQALKELRKDPTIEQKELDGRNARKIDVSRVLEQVIAESEMDLSLKSRAKNEARRAYEALYHLWPIDRSLIDDISKSLNESNLYFISNRIPVFDFKDANRMLLEGDSRDPKWTEAKKQLHYAWFVAKFQLIFSNSIRNHWTSNENHRPDSQRYLWIVSAEKFGKATEVVSKEAGLTFRLATQDISDIDYDSVSAFYAYTNGFNRPAYKTRLSNTFCKNIFGGSWRPATYTDLSNGSRDLLNSKLAKDTLARKWIWAPRRIIAESNLRYGENEELAIQLKPGSGYQYFSSFEYQYKPMAQKLARFCVRENL